MKRAFALLLSLLMIAALLPLSSAKAETLITGFTLSASGNLPEPKAGDTLYNPLDYISIAATEPAGNEAGLKLYAWWSDEDNGRIYPQSEFASNVFTPGDWELLLSVSRTGDYSIDYDNERFISGDLSAITLGGAEFRIYGRAYYQLEYYAEFEIDSTGVAPIFVDDSFTRTFNNGDDISIPFHASGEEPITYAVKSGTIPSGLSLSSDGMLTGTCTSPGTFSFVIEATNAIGSDTLPCEITVKDVTRIKAFTLAVDGGVIPVPTLGHYLWFPDDYLTVTSTIPAGNAAGLTVSTRWYNHTTNETFNKSSGIGKKFTEGEWELYILAEPASSDYVLDYDGYFADGQSLHTIMLGGQPFTAWTNYYEIGYSTYFFLGNPPETINLQYDAVYTLPEISDRMTGKQAHQLFLSSIRSRHGSSYYDPDYGGYDTDGWFVDTSSEWTGLTDDPGEPSPLKDSEELLIPQEPYWLSFDVALAPGCKWNTDQAFTVNGSADVTVSEYTDDDGSEHYIVTYMILSKEDLSEAEVYGIEPKNYNGSAQTQPKMKIVCDGETLIEGQHYVVGYEDNVNPGYAIVTVKGVGNYTGSLSRNFRIFDSEHPHEVIDTLEATSDVDTILAYGNEIETPTFTVTAGEPAYFDTGMGGWDKLIDGEWKEIRSGKFTAGEWRFGCQIRIDEGGDTYAFSHRPTCTVDGVDWDVSDGAQVYDTYSYTWVTSPTFTVAGGGELVFNKLGEYDIGNSYVNEPIPSFSVAGSVDGGTMPYTFGKVSGPDWITVSSDGTISGTPYQSGANESLVVRVTDDADAYAEIEIYVSMTARKQEDKIQITKVVATSDMKTMAVAGNTLEEPTFTVTEGAPAYFHPWMGNWEKKVGDEWQYLGYTATFTPGIWRFRCQLRIDEGGEDYVLADGSTVIVDGKEWTRDYYTATGFAYCYTYVTSPEIVIEDNSFSVSIDPADVQMKGTTPYVIANGSAQTPGVIVKDESDNVIDPSLYTVKYLENTQPGTGYAEVTMTATGSVKRAFFKIYLPATTTTTVANIDTGIQIKWTKVDGADGYVIYRRAWSSTTGGWTDFVRWNNTTALEWTDTKVYAGTRYQYGIKAYFAKRTDPVSGATIGGNVGDNYNLGVVGPLKTTVRITTRTLNSITGGSKQVTVKWSGSSVFTGYQVQIATNAAFTKDVKTVKITNPKTYQTVIKSLKANTTYYARVRSYQVFEGMTYYGGWSNVKSAKTK